MLHGGAVRPARRGAAVDDPGLRLSAATSPRGARPVRTSTYFPACCTTGTTGRRSGRLDLPDVPDVHVEPAGGARRPTPRASKPRGSPGCADRGRAPRLMPAGSDTQTNQVAPGAAAAFRCTARRGDARMFHVEPEAVSRRSADPDARPVLSHDGSAGVLGDRCSSIRPPGFTWNGAGLQMLLLAVGRGAGRTGCWATRPTARGPTAPTYVGAASRGRSLSPPTRSATASAAALPVAATRVLLGDLQAASRRGVRHQPA